MKRKKEEMRNEKAAKKGKSCMKKRVGKKSPKVVGERSEMKMCVVWTKRRYVKIGVKIDGGGGGIFHYEIGGIFLSVQFVKINFNIIFDLISAKQPKTKQNLSHKIKRRSHY